MIPAYEFHSLLIPIVFSLLILSVGFNLRERNLGVFLMWLGMLCILATILIKILTELP